MKAIDALNESVDTDQHHYLEIDKIGALSSRDFFHAYVGNKPVIIDNTFEDERPLFNLKAGRFCELTGAAFVPAKRGDISKGAEVSINLRAYLTSEAAPPASAGTGPEQAQIYIHDVSVLDFSHELQRAASHFRSKYLPRWYRKSGWRLLRLFISKPGNITPMHFDTLETHNLFFQIDGKKEFILVPSDCGHLCYLFDWRWSSVSPTAPDYKAHPDFAGVPRYRAVLNAGEALYIPPRWLHQVRSLETSISANIDWHTIRSASRGLTSVCRGAPARNFWINLRYFLGLLSRVPLPLLLHQGIVSRRLRYEEETGSAER